MKDHSFDTQLFTLTDEAIMSADFPADIAERAEASRNRIFEDILEFITAEKDG